MKNCAMCNQDITGMKDANRRKFCSVDCYSRSLIRPPKTDANGRTQANNLYSPTECNRCGSIVRVERHHRDRNAKNNALGNIEGLCFACHRMEHKKELSSSLCAICGKEFIAASHRNRNKICSVECAREWGRIGAAKRWRAA